MVLKFDDDPMLNEFGIVILLRQVWVYVAKKGVLGEKKRKTKLRGR